MNNTGLRDASASKNQSDAAYSAKMCEKLSELKTSFEFAEQQVLGMSPSKTLCLNSTFPLIFGGNRVLIGPFSRPLSTAPLPLLMAICLFCDLLSLFPLFFK